MNWFQENLWNTAVLLEFGGIILKISLILIVANIMTRIGKAFVRKFFIVTAKTRAYRKGREQTLVKLCENVIYYVVYFIALITILEIFIDIKGILAGAGVVGLAVAFGAQGLVKDVVTGFFILFEDQFSVGDKVKINTIEGTVEELGLRTTQIKGNDGEMYYITNSMITQVANYANAQPKQVETSKSVVSKEKIRMKTANF
ncbi:mechanosensitive ion channel family protein [Paenibacillus lignilyticus]|uniref:Mechanosensitive ion channel n=1 Tax=Paenibacillus lignilyticus TaxID=1172615 RepID=A0ABS5CNG3_9BACL|nr:mechanosensitive ion channel domain-containing protein [Paenibacillus lignilyticus]MBP3967390.1 mechanosensitive ion channel [Paenibacillus lignilyticus]